MKNSKSYSYSKKIGHSTNKLMKLILNKQAKNNNCIVCYLDIINCNYKIHSNINQEFKQQNIFNISNSFHDRADWFYNFFINRIFFFFDFNECTLLIMNDTDYRKSYFLIEKV